MDIWILDLFKKLLTLICIHINKFKRSAIFFKRVTNRSQFLLFSLTKLLEFNQIKLKITQLSILIVYLILNVWNNVEIYEFFRENDILTCFIVDIKLPIPVFLKVIIFFSILSCHPILILIKKCILIKF